MLTKGFGPPSPGNPAAASLRRSVPRHSAVQLSSPRKALYGMAIISMVGLAMACNNQSRSPRNIEPAFYYWKSVYDPSALEKKYMDSLRVNTLYVRFFDVDWDEVNRQPAPKALVRFVQKPTAAVIPTLFITNETLLAIDSAQAQALGGNLVRLLKGLLEKYDLPMPGELQIDCDWSASTRAQYFALLRAVKKTMPGPTLSATIRLYQTKYYDRAGVPPVDKGLLMCYNMGNLKYAATGNSIIETNELQKYTGNLASYPLPLDVGLPLFDWKVWFRQGKYHGITQALPDSLLKRPVFAADPPALGSQRFTVLQDTVLAGYPLQKGDLLRLETSDYPVVLAAAQHLAQRLKNTQCRVSLYHLDSVLLAKYSRHELESLFNGLR